MTTIKYGILKVTFNMEQRQFIRNWVTYKGNTILFPDLKRAHNLAEDFKHHAEYRNIKTVGYRARQYDQNYKG